MTMDPTIQRTIEQVHIDSEMEALLASRPGFAQPSPIGDSGIEGGTRALTSTASEIEVWNRETGEPSTVIFDALRARMNQRFPADHPNVLFRRQRVYTLHPTGCECGRPDCEPAPPVVRGNLPCPLSPVNKDRAEVEALGYGHIVCPKPAYFATEYDVELHVEKSHPRYFAQRERKRERDEREQAKQDNAELRAALAQTATGRRGKPGD